MDQRLGHAYRMIVAAAVPWLIGCAEAPSNSCAYTEEFRTYVIVVVNTTGTPVTNLTPSITLVRTGQPITPLASPIGGTYPVLSDAELPLILAVIGDPPLPSTVLNAISGFVPPRHIVERGTGGEERAG